MAQSKSVFDIVIIGAGLIGLATARALQTSKPDLKLLIIEKDQEVATQQSGHNSGVIHSGIYYKPGSFKATFCVAGRASLTKFCEENEIPVWTCGKLIIATAEEQVPLLENLYQRGIANKVDGLEIVTRERIKEIEPHVAAQHALWAPKTGIVNFQKVAEVYARQFLEAGGEILFRQRFMRFVTLGKESILYTETDEFVARAVINCAGLQSDLVADIMGDTQPQLQIVPFRGEYYVLKKNKEHLVKGLIYPVPNPLLPFLGVHFTQTMKGVVEAGPNAVLAFKREGYRKTDVSINDLVGTLSYPGFWKLIAANWAIGLWELRRSFIKSEFVKSLQELIPEVTADDLVPGGSGVRAQAVAKDGALIDDFRIVETARAIHVLNAPSPGATSSLIIGKHIAEIAVGNFAL